MILEKTNFRKLNLGRSTIGVIICILMLTTSVAPTLGNFVNTDEQTNTNSLNYSFLFAATQEFEINSNIYSSDEPFPSTILSDYSIGYSHGYAILSFGLNPIQ